MSTSVPPAVLRARELVDPAMRVAVDGLSPMMRQVSGYHLGWLEADGSERPGAGGKALRPALTLLAAEAVGADAVVAVPGAVAVELVHNFSLLHDDLMDNDEERRHRTTAWKLFGPAAAILAGDALLALAEQVLLAAPGEPALRAARCVIDATQELITGQVDDLAFEQRMDVTVEEVLAMEVGKTGALLACATAVGALLGGRDTTDPAVAALSSFGGHLGLAFQLVDDLLGIWGRPEVTGKPVLSDLRARKKSVPVVVALRAGGASSERLAALLAQPRWTGEEDIALAAKLVEDAGGRDWTAAEADRRLGLARAALADVPLAGRPRAELLDVAAFVTAREL